MKKTLTILFLILFSSLLLAQSNTVEINEIKMNADYIYGEATLADKDESVELAKELLINNIKEWLTDNPTLQSIESVVVKDIVKSSNMVSLMRGKMYRSFVYVKKTDILPIDNLEDALVISKGTFSNPDVYTLPEPDTIFSATPEPSEIPDVGEQNSGMEQLSIGMKETLDRMMKIEYSADVIPTFNELKIEKKIAFGKYTSLKSTDDCYLLIYNKYGEVVSILDKGHSTNLDTGIEDSVKNYEGCGAVWFQLLNE